MRDRGDEVWAVAQAMRQVCGGTMQQLLDDAEFIVEELEWEGFDIVKVEE